MHKVALVAAKRLFFELLKKAYKYSICIAQYNTLILVVDEYIFALQTQI